MSDCSPSSEPTCRSIQSTTFHANWNCVSYIPPLYTKKHYTAVAVHFRQYCSLLGASGATTICSSKSNCQISSPAPVCARHRVNANASNAYQVMQSALLSSRIWAVNICSSVPTQWQVVWAWFKFKRVSWARFVCDFEWPSMEADGAM